MATPKQDEREQNARTQLAEIKERITNRLRDLATSDDELSREMRKLQRRLVANESQRDILAWILNGDLPEEPSADAALDTESEEAESE